MKIYDFKFGGTALSEFFGVTTERPPVREIAKYDETYIEMPGRSGDDRIDNKRYKNVSFTRRIGFIKNRLPGESVDKVIEWLGYLHGYQEFEDTDHPGQVTYASLRDFGDIKSQLEKFLSADLKFYRVPFWYDKDALSYIELPDAETLEAGIRLFNPHPIESAPLIVVELKPGVFSTSSLFVIKIGEKTFRYMTNRIPLGNSAAEFRKYVYFDCDSGEVYTKKSENDSSIQYADVETPDLLPPGESSFGLQYGWVATVNSMKIMPRWRSL